MLVGESCYLYYSHEDDPALTSCRRAATRSGQNENLHQKASKFVVRSRRSKCICVRHNFAATLKLKKIWSVSAPKSDSPSPGAIWAKFKPKKPHQMPIPSSPRWESFQPVGQNQPKVIGLYWPWLSRIRPPKSGLNFTHSSNPIFRAKTDLSDFQWHTACFQRSLWPVSMMSCYSLGAPDLIVCVLFWYTSF